MRTNSSKDAGSEGATETDSRDAQVSRQSSDDAQASTDSVSVIDHAAISDSIIAPRDSGRPDTASAAPEANVPDASNISRGDSSRFDLATARSDASSDAAKADLIADTTETDMSAEDMGKPEISTQVDAGTFVAGVQVLTYKDHGPADNRCVGGTADWLAAVDDFVGEDRKCWADTDCMYVSFANSCGQICPVPINIQRTGEFYSQAVASFDSKCSTCPTPDSDLRCPAPPGAGEVTCRNNICNWK